MISSFSSNEEQFFQPKQILDERRGKNGCFQYKIAWNGLKSTTWQSAQKINKYQNIVQQYKNKKKEQIVEQKQSQQHLPKENTNVNLQSNRIRKLLSMTKKNQQLVFSDSSSEEYIFPKIKQPQGIEPRKRIKKQLKSNMPVINQQKQNIEQKKSEKQEHAQDSQHFNFLHKKIEANIHQSHIIRQFSNEQSKFQTLAKQVTDPFKDPKNYQQKDAIRYLLTTGVNYKYFQQRNSIGAKTMYTIPFQYLVRMEEQYKKEISKIQTQKQNSNDKLISNNPP